MFLKFEQTEQQHENIFQMSLKYFEELKDFDLNKRVHEQLSQKTLISSVYDLCKNGNKSLIYRVYGWIR